MEELKNMDNYDVAVKVAKELMGAPNEVAVKAVTITLAKLVFGMA